MQESAATPLERALVRHALVLLQILDDLPEEQIELGTAVRLQEDVAHLVDSLGPEDRARFFTIGEQLVQEADSVHAAWIRNSMVAIGRTDDFRSSSVVRMDQAGDTPGR